MPQFLSNKFYGLSFLLISVVFFSCQNNKTTSTSDSRESRPGVYSGYSEKIYAEDYQINSQYIKMRDGNKIAIDIYRPIDKSSGEVIEKQLPVLWMHTPYNRRYNGENTDALTVENYAGKAANLVPYGYVVATADFRGLYASYGHNEGYNRGEWVGAAQNDAYDITEWLAQQPWSNGKIGMWGCSATGGSQMQAASTAPPSLKAIFPMSFEFDAYSFRVPGGISGSRAGGLEDTTGMTAQEKRDRWAAPVEKDKDSTALKKAVAEHSNNIESAGYIPYRDAFSTKLEDENSRQWWVKSSPSTYLEKINNSGIAMYMAANWNEGFTKHGPFFAYNNIKTPRKLILGPGAHCDWDAVEELTNLDITVEELRFFDYWLKGIDNGIMEEPPVYYFTYNTDEDKQWKSATNWPLPNEKRFKFYLGEGSLSLTKEDVNTGTDKTIVNYDANPATDSIGVIIYETAPLESDMQVTGHPSINLWVSSSDNDGDFIATIQDVSPEGEVSSYNIQGQLRASTRKLTKPPYNNLGLPFHSSSRHDIMPLNAEEPTQLEFPILPTSVIFKKGHKIRLAISFSTRGTEAKNPAPEVTIHRDNDEHVSYLTLPIIE